MSNAQTGPHALLIGIDQYPRFPEENQLRGCRNDVELMADVLDSSFGFSRIVRLFDGEATRDGILAAMDALVRETEEDDVVVFFYSGHGSRVYNEHGPSPDGFEETLVPHDSGRREGENRDISDREIEEWLFELTAKTAYVTLIFDSCHAGSITRDPLGARMRCVEPLGAPPCGRSLGPRHGRSGWLASRSLKGQGEVLSERHVLIAACRSHESACELKYNEGSRPQGVLTFHLCQELRGTHPEESYRDLFERLAPRVCADYPQQHPQLEGAWDRELFGTGRFEPIRFVPVRDRRKSGSLVTLAAGAAHGLTAGSEWAVYPPGTRHTDARSEAELGRVRLLDRLDPVAARAEILPGERTEEICAGCRAVEVFHDHGEMCWTVAILGDSLSPQRREALESHLEKSRVLRPAENDGSAQARIHFLEPRRPVHQGDPVPQARDLDEPSWVVVKGAGELLLGPHRANFPTDELVRDLERCARYHLSLRLIQSDTWSEVHGLVDMELFRRPPRGDWTLVMPSAGEDAVFEEEDCLGFSITNRSQSPIYISVLDFGLTHAVSLLYPVRGDCKPLAPGRVLEIGKRRNDEIELFLPEGFRGTWGTEYVKLFATTTEADFSSLTQEGVRRNAGNSGSHPLADLLRKTLTGYGHRDARRIRTSDWTTLTRQFVLRRLGAGGSNGL